MYIILLCFLIVSIFHAKDMPITLGKNVCIIRCSPTFEMRKLWKGSEDLATLCMGQTGLKIEVNYLTRCNWSLFIKWQPWVSALCSG